MAKKLLVMGMAMIVRDNRLSFLGSAIEHGNTSGDECLAPNEVQSAAYNVIHLAGDRFAAVVNWEPLPDGDVQYQLSYRNCPDEPHLPCRFSVGYLDARAAREGDVLAFYTDDSRLPAVSACNECGCSDEVIAIEAKGETAKP